MLRKQKDCGLKDVTDGEFRRSWWHDDFFAGLNGIEKVAAGKALAFHGLPRAGKVVLTGRVDFTGHPHLQDFAFLKSLAGHDAVARTCIPAPGILHLALAVRDLEFKLPSCYRDEEHFMDMAAAYNKAIQAFYDASYRSLQLDDTSWGTFCSPGERAKFVRRGIDPDVLARKYVEMTNTAIEGHPDDMTVTMHICRDIVRSTWMTSGDAPVASGLSARAKPDGVFLKYDTDRAGDFTSLRLINDQCSAGAGLFQDRPAGRQGGLETARGRGRAARPPEPALPESAMRFSSAEEGNILAEEEQWNKIRLVVETPAEVWKDLTARKRSLRHPSARLRRETEAASSSRRKQEQAGRQTARSTPYQKEQAVFHVSRIPCSGERIRFALRCTSATVRDNPSSPCLEAAVSDARTRKKDAAAPACKKGERYALLYCGCLRGKDLRREPGSRVHHGQMAFR